MSLRWLFVAVTLLASLSFVVSVGSFGRLLVQSSEHRMERGRDVAQRELARLVASDPTREPPRLTVLGLHGGVLDPGAHLQTGVSPDIDRAVATLVAVAGVERAESASVDVPGGTVFIGARSRDDGRVAWIAYPVSTPKFLGAWRTTVTVLTTTTLLLGLIAVIAVVGTTRGARALRRSLAALEQDLGADVARPTIAELATVADGVASLARSLATAERERELLAAELRRQERLAALGRVVAGVAHEVRNPLAAMKLRVDVARTAPGVPADVADELEAIEGEIVRLDRLVTDFLVVSGRRAGRRVESDLGDIVRRRVAHLSPWAHERGVLVVAEGDARALVDADHYGRAVDNLLKNAVEASPPGASVKVRVDAEDGLAKVAVLDEGPGVPAQRAHELFEPFFTTKPEGTGLGLAVSRAIALASGGELSYRRDAGVTCFELSAKGAA